MAWRASGGLKTADSAHPNARICGGCITGYSTMLGTSDEGREPHDQSRQHAPWPGTHAAVRPATPEGGHRRAPDDNEFTRGGLHLRMIGDLLSRGSHQRVYSVKCIMMSILSQQNDLLHTDRSIEVLPAQTSSETSSVFIIRAYREAVRESRQDKEMD